MLLLNKIHPFDHGRIQNPGDTVIKRILKLNVDLRDKGKKHSVVKVKCDQSGIPLDHFWRQRVLDSQHDNCVEFVEEKTVKKECSPKRENKKSVKEIDPKGDK